MRGRLKNLIFAALLVATVVVSVPMAKIESAYAGSLDVNDLLNSTPIPTEAPSSSGGSSSSRSDTDFIDGIVDGLDHSKAQSEEVLRFGQNVQNIAGIIIQALIYLLTAGMTISKVIDIIFVALPFTRSFLSNGYYGNPMAAGSPQPQGGMGGMGGGMGGMGGGLGGMGGGMMGGMGGGYGGGYGRGGMGGGMNNMMGQQGAIANQNQPARGRIQIVSNAALNAVSTESVIGPDGKGQSAFKTYIKDMAISLTVVPVLLTLCATGVISKFGFMLGGLLGDWLSSIRF